MRTEVVSKVTVCAAEDVQHVMTTVALPRTR